MVMQGIPLTVRLRWPAGWAKARWAGSVIPLMNVIDRIEEKLPVSLVAHREAESNFSSVQFSRELYPVPKSKHQSTWTIV